MRDYIKELRESQDFSKKIEIIDDLFDEEDKQHIITKDLLETLRDNGVVISFIYRLFGLSPDIQKLILVEHTAYLLSDICAGRQHVSGFFIKNASLLGADIVREIVNQDGVLKALFSDSNKDIMKSIIQNNQDAKQSMRAGNIYQLSTAKSISEEFIDFVFSLSKDNLKILVEDDEILGSFSYVIDSSAKPYFWFKLLNALPEDILKSIKTVKDIEALLATLGQYKSDIEKSLESLLLGDKLEEFITSDNLLVFIDRLDSKALFYSRIYKLPEEKQKEIFTKDNIVALVKATNGDFAVDQLSSAVLERVVTADNVVNLADQLTYGDLFLSKVMELPEEKQKEVLTKGNIVPLVKAVNGIFYVNQLSSAVLESVVTADNVMSLVKDSKGNFAADQLSSAVLERVVTADNVVNLADQLTYGDLFLSKVMELPEEKQKEVLTKGNVVNLANNIEYKSSFYNMIKESGLLTQEQDQEIYHICFKNQVEGEVMQLSGDNLLQNQQPENQGFSGDLGQQ